MKQYSLPVIGVFSGPWKEIRKSQRGAVLGFKNIAEAAESAHLYKKVFYLENLDIQLFLNPKKLLKKLSRIDIVYANCGPLAAFLYYLRDLHKLKFQIVAELRTIAWIGYIFLDFIISFFQEKKDIIVHPSHFSRKLWVNSRGDRNDIFYYPLGEKKTNTDLTIPKRQVCAYFSRITSDKGFHIIPDVIERLIQYGWTISKFFFCGPLFDRKLYKQTSDRLSNLNISSKYFGELSHENAMELMNNTDVVLFPSLSSIESLGRVIIESYLKNKLIFTADYGSARYLVTQHYRLPVELKTISSGSTIMPFPIGEWKLNDWQPPSLNNIMFSFEPEWCNQYISYEGSFYNTIVNGFRYNSPTPNPQINFTIMWPDRMANDPIEICKKIFSQLSVTTKNRRDLLDLGGALHRLLLRNRIIPFVKVDHCRA